MPDFAEIRREFDLPADFPSPVLSEADEIAHQRIADDRRDLTDVPFVTIDPPGSKDLDQAMHLARVDGGWRVQYAIADVGAVVSPGSEIDAEARRRGQTIYLPDARVPLHPPVLSEGALSLLPEERRRAVVWTIDVQSDGVVAESSVERAIVRSVAQLDYEGVQADVDAERLHPSIEALPDLGLARRAHRIGAGAIELGIPEQAVVPDGDDWTLTWRRRIPVEGANAEVSLLTGTVAAQMMLKARVGLLRTLPEPSRHDIQDFLERARTCGVRGDTPAEVLATLHGSDVGHLALMQDATSLLRGAGYEAFDGAGPRVRSHAGIGEPYAQVTAPLRRLVDRFGLEVCLAVSAGQQVDPDVRAALATLPKLMGASDDRASQVDRAVIDQVEAWSVEPGQQFSAVVMRGGGEEATLMVRSPAVVARARVSNLTPGRRVTVEVAEVTGRAVTLTVVP